MSSLRASATIEMRRIRPRSEPTRWRNQQVRALAGWYLTHIQASSIIVVRRHGFPAFEMPCSWSTLPLFHGLGAFPKKLMRTLHLATVWPGAHGQSVRLLQFFAPHRPFRSEG
jgi:hypothetical protein